MRIISNGQFEQEVLNSANPVFVDFWATWCGPCNVMVPVVEDVAKEFEGKVDFVKVDVDQSKELATKYNVMSIPDFIIFQNGKVLAQLSGILSKESLRKYIQNYSKVELKA
jgi:thioredoxin 1